MNLKIPIFSERIKELSAIAIITLVIILFCLPILEDISNPSYSADFNQVYSYCYFARNTIIRQHQFPLRCPYFGGGYPLIAHPQDMSLSPLFILVLITGEIIGLKILIVAAFLLCGFGMYYLTRKIWQFSRFAAVFSALTLALSAYLPRELAGGNFVNIYYYFLPLIIAFMIKGRQDKKFLIYCIFLLTIALLQGALAFAAICLFLFIFLLFYPFDENGLLKINNLKYLLVVFMVVVLLGAVKIIPMVELLHKNSRIIEYSQIKDEFLNIPVLFKALINKGFAESPFFALLRGNPRLAEHGYSLSTQPLLKAMLYKRYYELPWLYIGNVVILFALLGFIFNFKKLKGALITLFIIIFILLGPRSPIELSRLLWKVPVFSSVSTPDKYYSFFIIFILCIAAFYFLNFLQRKFKSNLFNIILLIAFSLNTLDLFTTNIFFNKMPFLLKLHNSQHYHKGDSFAQLMITGFEEDRGVGGYLQYELPKRNIGLINWYGNIILGEYAIPKYFCSVFGSDYFLNLPLRVSVNPEYKGELFFLSSEKNSATLDKFTPNIIKVKTKLLYPDTLVINQNFDSSWKIDIGKLYSYNGLLAVKIDQPGEHSFKLTYLPKGFFIGLLVSLISFIILLIAVIFIK